MSHNHHSREENIKFAIIINVAFTIIEIIGGLWTNSLAILSDALHDFGDSIALITSLVAEKQARRPADKKRTFGYQRISLFSAFFAALVLVAGSLLILSVAIPRLFNPEHTKAEGMIGLAMVGIFFNGLGAIRLKKGSSQNEKVLSWHLMEDVFGWFVILIGGTIIYFWDNHIIDPILTLGFTTFILWGVFRNLKETVNIFLQGVPAHIDIDAVGQSLMEIEGVKGVHDIHIWSLEGETDIFTGHVVVETPLLENRDRILTVIKKNLGKHHIEHSTIELESEQFCSGIDCNNGLDHRDGSSK